MTMEASRSPPSKRLVNDDYPAPEAGSFDKERHVRTAAVKLRAGLTSTKEARFDYLNNCADSQKANEVFILQGSN